MGGGIRQKLRNEGRFTSNDDVGGFRLGGGGVDHDVVFNETVESLGLGSCIVVIV